MGRVKHDWMEQQERGWYSIDDAYVCANCFGDYAIKEFIDDNAVENTCSYCGLTTEQPSAASMDDVMQLIVEGIRVEWGDPNNEGMSFESREGGWLGKVVDSWDLLYDEIGLEVESSELFEAIFGSIGDNQWCQRNLHRLLPQDSLGSDWKNFTYRIKHFSRFVFYRLDDKWKPEGDFDDSRPTSLILEDIGRFVNQHRLVREIDVGDIFFRVRLSDPASSFTTIQELGPPTAEKAAFSNRMSPAGISMFYGASDIDTALLETGRKKGSKASVATIAKFEALKPFKVIDLTKIPFIPSLFDGERRDIRPGCIFLNRFLEDITRPVKKDGREHIEFVPTQVVTEYFRHLFALNEEEYVMGMAFPSAVSDSGVSWVLFMSAAPGEDGFSFDESAVDKWLSLTSISRKVLAK